MHVSQCYIIYASDYCFIVSALARRHFFQVENYKVKFRLREANHQKFTFKTSQQKTAFYVAQ